MAKRKIKKVLKEFEQNCALMEMGLLDPYSVGYLAFKQLGYKDPHKKALDFANFVGTKPLKFPVL